LCSIQTSFVTVGNYPGIEARLYGSEGAFICRLVEEHGICERIWLAGKDHVEFTRAEVPAEFYPPGGRPKKSWRTLFYANLVSSFIGEILAEDDLQRGQLRRRRVGAGDDQRGRAVVPGAAMGDTAARVGAAGAAGAALDRFFDTFYRQRPVTATFTGLHRTTAPARLVAGGPWRADAEDCGRCAGELEAAGRVPTRTSARFRAMWTSRSRTPRSRSRSPNTTAATSCTATRRSGRAKPSSAC
jgi:hypothetical protein